MTCSTCYKGHTCATLSEINSAAQTGTTPWYPKEVAQNVLNIMNAMGISTSTMNANMAVAAMDCQGCYTNPTSCVESGYTGTCSSPQTDEGFGVLQSTWTGSAIDNQSTVTTEIGAHGGQQEFFPAGVNLCSIERDPGTAFSYFYYYALGVTADNCQTLGQFIGAPTDDVSCAECQYMAAEGLSSC